MTPQKRYSPYQYAATILFALFIGIGIAFVLYSGVLKVATEIKTDVRTDISTDATAEAFLEEGPVTETIESAPDGTTYISSGERPSPVVGASSYIVIDATTGAVLGQKDAERTRPVASITKLVTAVVATNEMNSWTRVTISPSMLVVDGNSARFRTGEKLTVGDLLYPLLMVSSNDAAEALAQSYGRKAFIRKMNDWVNDSGAYSTYFSDPSGLSPNNISSAHDIARIALLISKDYSDIIDITHTKIRNTRIHTWVNPTHFLNLTSYEGGKNGYTTEAGRTGVAIFKTENKKIIIVVLGSKNRDRDTLELLRFYE